MAKEMRTAMSVVNRVRFTAWAWMASAFLLGATVGGFATGAPLWSQLQAAKDDTARLRQVELLTKTVALGPDVDALVSLEAPPRADPPQQAPKLEASPTPEPAPVVAQVAVSNPVAKVQAAAPAEDVALVANAARAEEADRKAAEARKVAAAEEAERKAKVERQARLEREQKIAKAAQEAQQRKEREQAEARVAAARAKPAVEQPERREAAVQVAAPVPVAGTNGPTERVTKEEAGLAEVNAGGVTFKSGRRVAVGDSFPSGEKLISIDPRIGEIITSKRRIVIKPSAS
ncbi:hypothetical protein [Variovorax ginsengisoli]|uniref:Protein TolA n=1 Tax=Variovorax ginsengisoli TaxID=363844 RepID=A0ABT8SBU3_9BURK|nr:hypothetical protein [Variovorax ginsengisoli]MDN8617213.1 hypothetical protein [Variovorax ginsengisoli]MDO1536383.1 hypothetical protein [Variovorax ginsengisoli]